MQTLGSAASVVASIHEDADAEVQRIEETTAAELASIRREAETVSIAIADREEQLSSARRINEERVARQEWDGRRAVISQRETWLWRVVAKAQQMWTGGDRETRRAHLNALIGEALSRMPASGCEIALSPHDRDLIDPRDMRITIKPIGGGCIASTGNVTFDNSFEARARRLEPEWRNALSGMYKP